MTCCVTLGMAQFALASLSPQTGLGCRRKPVGFGKGLLGVSYGLGQGHVLVFEEVGLNKRQPLSPLGIWALRA